ncbi:ABC transporter substrate-binding protein [Taklimakanibacter deserti]|uniref:ABC transporter substrate-binding protein n=1 Tax=Taklimakanibacter deserti TaxID=2267839 RepID=UPI000E65A363
MNRRTVLKAAGAQIALFAGLASGAIAEERVLRVLTWEGYNDEKWVKAFEAETGAKVSITYVYSVDEITAKMTASKGQDYDVLAIETSSYKRLIEQGLIQPLDRAKIPNLANLLPPMQNLRALNVDGKLYGVPYAWGSVPLIYAKAAFPTPPDSWSIMWDERYRGKVIVLDDANNNVVTMALALGLPDPFNLTDEQFAQIKAKLLEVKRNVVTYYAGFDEGASIFAQGGIDLMAAMAEPQVKMIKSKGVDVGLVIPKERAIGWFDCWAITAGARDMDLAYAWIDFFTRKEVGAALSATHEYGNSVDQAANEAIGLDYADRLTFLDAPEDFAKRVNLWNEVKATPVQ